MLIHCEMIATNSHTSHFTSAPLWWYVTGHRGTLELQNMFTFQSGTSACSTITSLFSLASDNHCVVLAFLSSAFKDGSCNGDFAMLVFLPDSVHLYGTQRSVYVLTHHTISLFPHLANILWYVFLFLLVNMDWSCVLAVGNSATMNSEGQTYL